MIEAIAQLSVDMLHYDSITTKDDLNTNTQNI